ncbi:MAG: FMN-binding negative transcriptional regulator [Candidatus Thiodiazotropha lotti]|nr:FMN-binding negative transcriptional regulator [Candidatus Thiodiazotropha lotti]
MYIPQHFEVTDKEDIFAFIEANAFGQLISMVNGSLFSSHIPFLLSNDQQTLIGHLAKPNPQWEGIEGQEILVTFQGPHDYISPSWYASVGVPTWNYQAVHVYGKCEPIFEPEKLTNIVEGLTRKYESSFEEPWKPEYRESLLRAIVGLEIEITEIQCKYKLSQNRTKQDKEQVVQQLEKKGSIHLSHAVKSEL